MLKPRARRACEIRLLCRQIALSQTRLQSIGWWSLGAMGKESVLAVLQRL